MTERERESDGTFEPEVTDEELLGVLREADSPVLSARMIADELPIGRQAVYERLYRLHDAGRVEKLKVGAQAVVWWVTDDHE